MWCGMLDGLIRLPLIDPLMNQVSHDACAVDEETRVILLTRFVPTAVHAMNLYMCFSSNARLAAPADNTLVAARARQQSAAENHNDPHHRHTAVSGRPALCDAEWVDA